MSLKIKKFLPWVAPLFLLVLLFVSNGLWVFAAIDQGVTFTYQQDSLVRCYADRTNLARDLKGMNIEEFEAAFKLSPAPQRKGQEGTLVSDLMFTFLDGKLDRIESRTTGEQFSFGD